MKSWLNNAIKVAGNAVVKYAPEILIGMGIVGTGTAIAMAVAATPKAMKKIDAEIERQNEEITEAEDFDEETELVTKLPKKEVVKLCWKYYIPTVAMATVSIACIVGANSINHKRNALLGAAYELTQTAYDEYKDAVKEELGVEKEREIRDKVVHKRVEPVMQECIPSDDSIINTGYGNTLFYIETQARYFRSDMAAVNKAFNDVNHRMLKCENDASLNDLYEELGLPCTSTGDNEGWNVDHGMIEWHPMYEAGPFGEPCAVIVFDEEPRANYRW